MSQMTVYIASSWKNQHAVEMLTSELRKMDIVVRSFVENNHGECNDRHVPTNDGKEIPFEEWVWSERGRKSFVYDTDGATTSDLVIYVSPSGTDAWCEVGAAWASGVPIIGLWAKGEQCGLMRRCMNWHTNYRELLSEVEVFKAKKFPLLTKEAILVTDAQIALPT